MAAGALDMRVGSAARIRAVALTASQAEISLPPTRAGETADPDYNPKIYVEREKAAVKAAQAAGPPPVAAEPGLAAAAPAPVATAPAAAPAAVAAAAPAPIAAEIPKAAAPEKAGVIARLNEPAKQAPSALPDLTEPAAATPPAVTTPAPTAATLAVAQAPAPSIAPGPTAKIPADTLPIPEASPVYPGSPKPAPLGMSLPTPDQPSIPTAGSPMQRGGYLAQAPEILGGSTPQPRKPAVPRLAIAEPLVPVAAARQVIPQEKASVDALSRPGLLPLRRRQHSPNPRSRPISCPSRSSAASRLRRSLRRRPCWQKRRLLPRSHPRPASRR